MRRRSVLWVLPLLIPFGTVDAQSQDTGFRVQGVIMAPSDEPVEGAEVRLFQQSDPDGRPAPVLTDSKGEWAILQLSPGRWEIEISAEGFLNSEGWIQVLQGRPTPLVEVELRALDEDTPAFFEGDRGTIQRWIERGNQLLEQGKTGEARAEYEKAIGALPAAEHPQILQAVARTHFLEQKYDAAVATLEDALRIAPGDNTLRQLYRFLMEELGRGDQVDQRIVELGAEGAVDAEPEPAPAPSGPAIERPPIDTSPTAGRTGHYRTRFLEHAPLAAMDTYLKRFGYTREQIAPYDEAMGRYDLANESFDIYVPENESGEPYGLFVFISPTPFGGFTKDEVGRALDERNLIWVGADNTGNARAAWYRVNLALDAAHNLSKLYEIDSRRVYISGYSGGGRLASAMALLYPEVFTGGFFFYGTDWFEPLPVPFQPGATWPAKFPQPRKRALERLQEEARLVFLTGARDFNRPQTKTAYRRAVATGFAYATYLEIPEADHYYGITGEWLARGLDALDAPLAMPDGE